jgi:hypothetical protein
MLWIHDMKVSGVIRSVVIANLKWVALRLNVGMPTNALKDCLATVVIMSSINDLKREFDKQVPNMRILFMVLPPLLLNCLAHFLQPIVGLLRT